jgi:hypothetical protein
LFDKDKTNALHHIPGQPTLCHMIGNRPFTQRDRSTNFWALAILSMGESWHNLTTLIPPVPVTASPVASST